MSLVIDSNLEYLQNILHISNVTFQEKYADMSVDEILEAEAAAGNQYAIELAKELTSNTSLVMELFDLADTENKYMILRELTSQQLQEFLPEMEEKDLLQGLFFFTQDKLMKLLEELPAEQLVNTVFEMFSQEEVVKFMPDEQLNKFLTSTDIDKNKILKHMQSIPEEYVAKDALMAFQPTQKQQLVLSLGKEHEEWFQLFDADAYTKIINREKQQPEVVKAMSVIEPEYIQNMLKELPNDLLSLVITQMDTKQFTEMLMEQFPEVIAEIIMK